MGEKEGEKEEEQEERKKQWVAKLWDNFNSLIYVQSESLKGKREENLDKKKQQLKIFEHFLSLINPQIQEAQWTQSPETWS